MPLNLEEHKVLVNLHNRYLSYSNNPFHNTLLSYSGEYKLKQYPTIRTALVSLIEIMYPYEVTHIGNKGCDLSITLSGVKEEETPEILRKIYEALLNKNIKNFVKYQYSRFSKKTQIGFILNFPEDL